MNESSDRWRETARNMKAALLQRLRGETNQSKAAEALDVHKSTVNRLVNEHADDLLALLSYLGFQLADRDALLVPKEDFQAMARFAVRGIETMADQESD